MRYLKMPAEAIEEAEMIKWGMHQHSHNWHKAKKRGDQEAMNRARKKIRALDKIFNEKFIRNL